MQKFIKYSIYLLSPILLSLFIIIYVSENTDLIENTYKQQIIQEIQDSTDLKVNIDNMNITWIGLKPSIQLNNIIIKNKDDVDLIKGKKLIVTINLIQSIANNQITPIELNLVSSDIRLEYNKESIYFKNYNLISLQKDFNNDSSKYNFSNLKFRVSSSNILLINAPILGDYKLNNINLVLFNEKSTLKVFSTFNQEMNNQVIHFAADLIFDKNNKPSGTFYSKGLGVDIKQFNIMNNIQVSLNNTNYVLWAYLNNGTINNINGKLDIKNVNFSDKKNKFEYDDISTNLLYKASKRNSDFVLNNLDFKSNNKVYQDNKFLFKSKGKAYSAFLKDLEVLDLNNILEISLPFVAKTYKNKLESLYSGSLANIKLFNLLDKRKLEYSLDFENASIINDSQDLISNISGNIAGNLKNGDIALKSNDVSFKFHTGKQLILDTIKGNIKYISQKNTIYISTSSLNIDDLHQIKLKGYLKPKLTNIRLVGNGDLESISRLINDNNLLDSIRYNIGLSGKYKIDYRFYKKDNKENIYGALDLMNLIIKNPSNKLIISGLNTRVNFSNKYLISSKNDYYLNDKKFKFSLNTLISDEEPKYYLETSGIVKKSMISNIINSDIIDEFSGQSFAKIILNYQPKSSTRNLSLTIISDLYGTAFDIIGPIRKGPNEKKVFKLFYKLNNNKKNVFNILYDSYKIVLTPGDASTLANVDSASIKGDISWPPLSSLDNRVKARLIYLDLNKFSGVSKPSDIPYLHVVAKQVKVEGFYLDNVDLIATPNENNLTIDNFSFTNNHLSMQGTGKWVETNDKQRTFFDTKFTSNNFGTALNSLGYSDLIKRGKLNSQLIGEWGGSPGMFKFSSFSGKVIMDMTDGEFLQVTKETRAIGQFLGLFSVSSLSKRLTLDFSDFFSSGLSFDEMNGEVVFNNGKSNMQNVLLLGSFGEMRLSGETDLVEETYDQTLIYIPDLSSTSLITGTIIGGPVGAVASIFYDRVLKEFGIDTNKLAAIEYSITGPWQNPDIKITQSFKPLLN